MTTTDVWHHARPPSASPWSAAQAEQPTHAPEPSTYLPPLRAVVGPGGQEQLNGCAPEPPAFSLHVKPWLA